MKARPTIGVTHSSKKHRIMYYAIKFALVISGAKVKSITASSPAFDEEIDGLLLSGGIDIHPMFYNATPKENYPYEIDRDKMELAWMKIAEDNMIPILGICRGAQLINVFRCGTLHAEVAKSYEKAHYPSSLLARIFYRKRMHINNLDSLIHRIMGDDKIKVNSIHTQSIDLLGNNLKITASESNQVVQVIEDPTNPFILGLQFHPEFIIYSKYHRCIFISFIRAALKQT